jgi:alpha-beta hydrolase superfamily lysophospholipase
VIASYLVTGGTPVLVHLHEPAGPRRDTAVLMCPPFGWDDVCSYRSRRAWAESLAAEGYPVLRLDLPGTGDSGGGRDDAGRLGPAVAALAAAHDWLRAATGATRVAALGIGLGGLYACVAASRGTPFDDLVLWAVPARGKAVVREVRAFGRLGHGGALPDGGLAANGHVLPAAAVADLDAIDLATLPPPKTARALLLDRDGVPVDEGLRAFLAGGAVTVAPGPGYAALMARPQESVPPGDVMARVAAWLGEAAAPGAPPPAPCPPVETADVGGVRERLLGSGVLTEPAGPPAGLTAVLLNAGAIRRTGPNRMWVDIARRWAARGVPTVRADLRAIGDAAGPDRWTGDDGQFYEESYRAEVTALLDDLAARGLPDRFVLLGLCSGAYWSFHVGQDDPRVVGAVLLNPMTFAYDPFAAVLRTSRVLRRFWRASGWRRLLGGDSSFANVVAVLRAALSRMTALPRGRAVAVDPGLDRLRERGVRTVLVFSAGEPLREELDREGLFGRLDRWPNLTVHLLDGVPDTHTLQPLALQAQVHALVDDALTDLLSDG